MIKVDRLKGNTEGFIKLRWLGLALIFCTLGGATMPSALATDKYPARQPNIVFVLIDDMGWRDLGCTGSNYYQTPRIDQLAKQGIKFTQAYSNCVVCSPSRAAIYTGQYNARNLFTNVVIGENHDTPTIYNIGKTSEERLVKANAQHFDAEHLRVIPHEQTTFAEVFKSAGYATGFYGKWHCGYSRTFHPDKHGWGHAAGFRKFHRGTDPHWGKYWKDIVYGCPDLKDEDYFSDYLTTRAVAFIDEHHDKPFMLTLSHYLVHGPYYAKLDLEAKYKAMPGDDQRNYKYAGMVEAVDQSVGRIMDALKKHGIEKKTIIVFTSDNGGPILWSTSNLPLLGGKSFPYEAGTRVPMIVKWPGVVKPGSECDERVIGIDLYPTFCEMAGLPLPKGQKLDGQSLAPLLMGKGEFKDRALYWYYPHYTHAVGPYAAVIDGGWKLIRYFNDADGGAYELYDLRFDPYEYKDLSEDQPEKVAALNGKLDAWFKDCNARMPRPQPNYDASKPTHKGKNFTKNLAESQRLILQTTGCNRPGDVKKK